MFLLLVRRLCRANLRSCSSSSVRLVSLCCSFAFLIWAVSLNFPVCIISVYLCILNQFLLLRREATTRSIRSLCPVTKGKLACRAQSPWAEHIVAWGVQGLVAFGSGGLGGLVGLQFWECGWWSETAAAWLTFRSMAAGVKPHLTWFWCLVMYTLGCGQRTVHLFSLTWRTGIFSDRPCQEALPRVPDTGPLLQTLSFTSSPEEGTHLLFGVLGPWEVTLSGALKEGDPALHPTNSPPEKYLCWQIPPFMLSNHFLKIWLFQ